MNEFRSKYWVLRPHSLVCVGLLVAAAGWTSIGHGQTSGKGASETFADSPVDAIAARIRADLKALKATAPSDTPTTGSPNKPVPEKEPSTGTPTKSPAKTPGTPKAISSPKVRAVETNAQKCQTAEEALLLFQIFLADSATTGDEKEQAQARLEYWEQAATDQLVHVGTKWMPKPEAVALEKEADKLVEEALEMLNVDNFTAANAKLEKAGKIYPEHLESIFLLAVGAFLGNDFKAAELKFNQCLSRSPNNVALLNNVAVCEIQMKRYSGAVKHWEKAAAIDLENKNVAQNLGKFISDVNLKKFTGVDRRVLTDATEAYQKMVAKDSGNRADPSRGYAVLKMLRNKPGDPAAVEESRVVGNGTGFVIAEGYVLTNRHVVEDADSLVIQDPAKPNGLPLAAKVVASSKDLDVALIECRQLKAPAVPLNTVPVGRGTEVMALGFPIASVVGKGLKATRGIITGLPSEETDKMMVLDVQVNPGNSGGPLCDRAGRVVGVVAAKTYTATFVQGYGLAIPINDAMPFLKQHIRDFESAKSDGKTIEWTDVDALISPSTVMILIQKKR